MLGALLCILFIILCLYLYIYRTQKDFTKYGTGLIQENSLNVQTQKQQKKYVNTNYNFTFNLAEDREITSGLISHEVIEQNEQIIINQTIGKKKQNILTLDLFDGTNIHDSDLIEWWKNTIPNSNNYEVSADGEYIQLSSNAKAGIEVRPKEFTNTEVDKVEVYIFYDFTKPFILHYTIESSGGQLSDSVIVPLGSIMQLK